MLETAKPLDESGAEPTLSADAFAFAVCDCDRNGDAGGREWTATTVTVC